MPKLTPAEREAQHRKGVDESVQNILDLVKGVVKGATTDLPGFLLDVMDKLAGDTTVLGEKDRSAQMFKAVTGLETKGNAAELIGGLLTPDPASLAMIVGAARLGKDLTAVKALEKAKVSPATLFDHTDVYKEKGSYKTFLSDASTKLKIDPHKKGLHRLEDVVDHPDLFKAYPELKEYVVMSSPGDGAQIFTKEKVIHLGRDLPTSESKSALLHELQHAVQALDKTERGASWERLMEKFNLSQEDAYKLYLKVPGEVEARFTETTKNLKTPALRNEVRALLQAGATPSRPATLVDPTYLGNYTGEDTAAMIVGAARLGKVNKAIDTVKAEEMIAAGASPADIFSATGVMKDTDFTRKAVLSDRGVRVNQALLEYPTGMKDLPLPDILIHPKLYDLYPELKNIKVRPIPGAPGNATFYGNQELININPYTEHNTLTKPPGYRWEENKSVLLHETQHAIQQIENFRRGGNSNQFTRYNTESLSSKLSQAQKSTDPAVKAAAERFKAKVKVDYMDAFQRYLDLPGEQEARFTQSTRNLSEENLAKKVQELLKEGKTPSTSQTPLLLTAPETK